MSESRYRRTEIAGRPLAPETLMLAYGFDPKLSEGAVKTPLFLTSTFAFSSCEEGKRLFDYTSGRAAPPEGVDPGLIYSRFNNPNLQIVEERLAVLEQAEACAVFASGMAAIFGSLLAAAHPGEVVLRSGPLYGGTETLFETLLARFGIKGESFLDGVDPGSVRAAVERARAKGPLAAIYVETPANPTNTVVDLDLVAALADEAAAGQGRRPLVLVDNTLLGPLYQSPLAHGADVVLYSLTKYVGGHSDLVAGAALGSAAVIRPIRALRSLCGNQLDAHSSWMLTRSLETLRLRVDRAMANADQVAAWLAKHPAVERVDHLAAFPPDSPEARVVARQCRAMGATFSFVVKGGEPAAFRVLDALKVFKLAVSLGGTESLACHPASTTHSGVPEVERRRLGVGPGLVRLSIGVEAAEDLIADLDQALSLPEPV